ncbi:hypothetical protein D5F01_LYC20731 [Larimichthys crocea]|uniref:Uncharacterized protein n=1 Tax=Larimichthys crocea TaxID=215358 RepID=A0A6G0HRT3_LARCR|nr:hypothetical protein D5F01_LYC20731 [Larimichthys crocea]
MAAHLKREHNMPQSPATSASSAATPSREPRLLQFFPSLIQEIIKLMSPVKVATTLLSEEKSPTISMIAPIQAKLHKHFSEDNTDMPIITEMKRRFRQDFFDRYVELQELLNSASALDPRFKDLTFLDDVDSRDHIFMKITAEVVKMNEKMKGIGALDEGGALDDGGALDEGGAAEGGGDRSPSIEERRGLF